MKSNLFSHFKIFIILLFGCLGFTVSVQAGEMKMHAVYVDQGDAIIIESNGHFMLVDSGISASVTNVMDYLHSLDIPEKKFDYIISTHPDGDHVGGFPTILKEYDVEHVIYSPCTKSNKSYMNFIKALSSKDCDYRLPVEKEKFTLGDATVEVIYDGSRGSTYNESSIVLRVTCDNKSILLTGDLPSTIENELLNDGYNFKADVLKIGHHGAAASSCADFLDAVSPEYAVVSCEKPGTTDLPKDSVLQRLARRFIKLYRTTDANVLFFFKDGIISTQNKENNPFISIKKGTIALSNNIFYATGQQIKPTVTLCVNGQIVPANHYKVTYSSNVNTGIAKIKLTATEEKYVSVCSTTFLILPATETLSGSVTSFNQINLTWSKQAAATGYTIMYSTDKNFLKDCNFKHINNPNTTSFTFKKLDYNKKYYYKIRAYKTNIGYGNWSKTLKIKTPKSPLPKTPKISSVKKSAKNSIYIKWKKLPVSKNNGYYLQYSTNKSFRKNVGKIKIKSNKQTSKTINKLRTKKTYYVRIRGYNKYGKGNWSNAIKIKL